MYNYFQFQFFSTSNIKKILWFYKKPKMGNILVTNESLIEENNILKERILKLENKMVDYEKNKEKENIEVDRFYKNLENSVDDYVKEMLKDEEINSVIPDYIEKKIYKNVFMLMFKLMKKTTDSTKISFMNQEISLKFTPKIDNKEK